MVDIDVIEILSKNASANKEFLTRQLCKVTNNKQPTKYSPELKAFAITLHFYSPRAYNYVRKVFHTSLLHTRTILKWYQKIDCSPGFTNEALKALKDKAMQSNYPLICSLIIDEMAIRKHIEWMGRNFMAM